SGTPSVDYQSQHALAREFAEQCAVLLQNTDHLLPIKSGQSYALIGAMARDPRYQGAGSSKINPTRLTSVADAMQGCPYSQGYLDDGSTTEILLEEAKRLAQKADIAIVC